MLLLKNVNTEDVKNIPHIIFLMKQKGDFVKFIHYLIWLIFNIKYANMIIVIHLPHLTFPGINLNFAPSMPIKIKWYFNQLKNVLLINVIIKHIMD